MHKYLILALSLFSFGLFAQKEAYIQELDSLKLYHEIEVEFTKSIRKEFKELSKKNEIAEIKNSLKKLLVDLDTSLYNYNEMSKKSLAIYESANLYTIKLKKELSEEEDLMELSRAMDEVEWYASDLISIANQNKSQTDDMIESLNEALITSELYEINGICSDMVDVCKRIKSEQKNMSKKIKTTEKYCEELSEINAH